jgi:hypothetical protein
LRAPLLGIGCDAAQELAAEVLKFSVLRHSRVPIQVVKLHEALESGEIDQISLPPQRTSFSFQRFILAKLMLDRECEVAVYLDSDMLMLRPIDDLITLFAQTTAPIATAEPLSSWRRQRQSSVLVMTREGATQLWSSFQRHLAGEIGYDELIYLRAVGPVGTLPYHWNCLEYLDEQTALLHYTDMDAQPWLWDGNPNAGIWYTYLWLYARESRGHSLIEREIARGHVRPALRSIVGAGPSLSATSSSARLSDMLFVPPHRFRRIRNRTARVILAPLLRGAINMQFLLTNGQPNSR